MGDGMLFLIVFHITIIVKIKLQIFNLNAEIGQANRGLFYYLKPYREPYGSWPLVVQVHLAVITSVAQNIWLHLILLVQQLLLVYEVLACKDCCKYLYRV